MALAHLNTCLSFSLSSSSPAHPTRSPTRRATNTINWNSNQRKEKDKKERKRSQTGSNCTTLSSKSSVEMEVSLGHVVSAHRLGASLYPCRPAALSSSSSSILRMTPTDTNHSWLLSLKNKIMMMTTTTKTPSWPNDQLSTKLAATSRDCGIVLASKLKQAAGSTSELDGGGGDEAEQDQQQYLVENRLELLEEEEEAIMDGGDQGRDPTDYNRRAHIFDQCSKVFQALKDEEDEPAQQQQKHTHHCHS